MEAEKLGRFRIQAREHWNRTGLQLQSGETYAMEANETWFDRQFAFGPDGGPSQNVFRRCFEWARRRKHAPWFVLTGAVDSDEATTFRIGSSLRADRADRIGELTWFANDVWIAYGNNSGLLISRFGGSP